MENLSDSHQQFLSKITNLAKKMLDAAEQGEWDTVIALEKERTQKIHYFFAAVSPNEKHATLIPLIEIILQNNNNLQEKFLHYHYQLAHSLIVFNQGHKMEKTYKSIMRIRDGYYS